MSFRELSLIPKASIEDLIEAEAVAVLSANHFSKEENLFKLHHNHVCTVVMVYSGEAACIF